MNIFGIEITLPTISGADLLQTIIILFFTALFLSGMALAMTSYPDFETYKKGNKAGVIFGWVMFAIGIIGIFLGALSKFN